MVQHWDMITRVTKVMSLFFARGDILPKPEQENVMNFNFHCIALFHALMFVQLLGTCIALKLLTRRNSS